MTFQPVIDSFELAAQKFADQQDRSVRDMGFGSTQAAQKIISRHLRETTDLVLAHVEASSKGRQGDGVKEFVSVISDIDPYVVALTGLTGGITSVCRAVTLSKTFLMLGRMIEAEVWAQGLRSRDAKLAKRLEDVARKRNSSTKQRRQAVRSMAKKNGYEADKWNDAMRTTAGKWLTEVLLQTPMFTRGDYVDDNGREVQCITLTEEVNEQAQALTQALIAANPVPLPLLVPPRPWKDTTNSYDCANGRSYQLNLVRKDCKTTQRILKQAAKSGQLQPVFDALNAIQAVTWTINEPIRDLIVWAQTEGVKVPGLPHKDDVELPPALTTEEWEALDDDRKRLRRKEIAKKKEMNRTLNGERKTYLQDIAIADHVLANGNKFWTPYNMDYRGRVYSTCFFGFQRQDYVRSLFAFHEGKPLGDRGLYWLGIHLANCGDFGKCSKKPFEDRHQWVQDNLGRILAVGTDPKADLWWTEADSPFLFAAACIEYAKAFTDPTGHLCNIPVSFDGSCSGLQHLAAMTRCEVTAALVNVKPSDRPQDVYQTVADAVKVKVERVAAEPADEFADVAKLALAYGIDRKLTKRNVMTYSYSSPKFGMQTQQSEDTMRPLSDAVLRGELVGHPFAAEGDRYDGDRAAKFLGGIVFDTIEETVQRPAEAMTYLQKVAKALAHEGKHTQWTTPLGLPVVLRYPNMTTTSVQLWMSDQGQSIRTKVNLQEEVPGIDKAAAARAIAPSFVHSYDACHLQMVVLGALKKSIKHMAFVHDSFGCLPSDAEEFREVIRQEFYWLYSMYDVLGMIHQEASAAIETNHQRLPEVPAKGALNVEEVLNAQYAFA